MFQSPWALFYPRHSLFDIRQNCFENICLNGSEGAEHTSTTCSGAYGFHNKKIAICSVSPGVLDEKLRNRRSPFRWSYATFVIKLEILSLGAMNHDSEAATAELAPSHVLRTKDDLAEEEREELEMLIRQLIVPCDT